MTADGFRPCSYILWRHVEDWFAGAHFHLAFHPVIVLDGEPHNSDSVVPMLATFPDVQRLLDRLR